MVNDMGISAPIFFYPEAEGKQLVVDKIIPRFFVPNHVSEQKINSTGIFSKPPPPGLIIQGPYTITFIQVDLGRSVMKIIKALDMNRIDKGGSLLEQWDDIPHHRQNAKGIHAEKEYFIAFLQYINLMSPILKFYRYGIQNFQSLSITDNLAIIAEPGEDCLDGALTVMMSPSMERM